MKKLLRKIRDFLQGFVNWMWWEFAPPVMKPWCAIFYFVAQDPGVLVPRPEPAGTEDLGHKLKEAIKKLKATSFSGNDIHVVYRAVWRNWDDEPEASVVGPFLPPPATTYFPDCYEGPIGGPPVELGKDLPCFLKWAYKWCPAEHYAIFFWGHSFGPAGLFEPGGGLRIPQPLNLEGLKEAFEEFQNHRSPSGGQTANLPGPNNGAPASRGSTGGASGPPLTQAQIDAANKLLDDLADARPKVEVVLFQDCWMSTLETAYQIKNVVQYAIASQSLVPIGLNAPDFIWPYEKLLGDLLKPDFHVELTKEIMKFYEHNLSTIGSHLATVPIALLDLSKVSGITTPLGDLVHSLCTTRTKNVRGLQIESGRLLAFNPTSSTNLSAGDAALVDVALMCATFMNDLVPAVKQAATALYAALDDLIILDAEVGGAIQPPPFGGFRGVSVLYWPPNSPEDDYITRNVTGFFYSKLAFQKAFTKTRQWPGLEQSGQP